MSYLRARKLIAKYSRHNNAPSPRDSKRIQATTDALSRRCSSNFSEDGRSMAGILCILRALLVGMRQVPTEILMSILGWVLVMETYRVPGLTYERGLWNTSGLRLERVCSRWRQILIGNLSPHLLVHDQDRCAVRDTCRLLARKGVSTERQDLRFTIDSDPYRYWWPGQVDQRLTSLDGLIPRYASRIAELTLRSSLLNLLDFLSFPGVMSALRVLRLFCLGTRRDPGEREVRSLSVLAPKLQEFMFEHTGKQACCCGARRLPLVPKPCAVGLNVLISDERTAVAGHVEVLRKSAASIATCTVRTNPWTSLFMHPIASSDNDRVRMLSLGQLFLAFASTDAVSLFLNGIYCPSLWELRCSFSYNHFAAMAFFRRGGSNLTTLHLRLVKLDSSDLWELLVAQNKLETLVLDSITVDKRALNRLDGAAILPCLKVFTWLGFSSLLIPTIMSFISARCPGSVGRGNSSNLEDITLTLSMGIPSGRPVVNVLGEFQRARERWRQSGVKISFSGSYEI
ncbi:hypothetical protein C8R46DRAFT_1345340 [Mycena filopes]|nr:hypothetical protein C8R46DRAFT_1345340 [Mycena filopes]